MRAGGVAPQATTASVRGSGQAASIAVRRSVGVSACSPLSSSGDAAPRGAVRARRPTPPAPARSPRPTRSRARRYRRRSPRPARCWSATAKPADSCRGAEPPPGDARADAVGGLQRVEAAALAQLAAAERAVDVRRVAASSGSSMATRKRFSASSTPSADAAAELALERPVVLRNLLADRVEDLGGEAGQLGAQCGGEASRQPRNCSHRTSLATFDVVASRSRISLCLRTNGPCSCHA